MKKCCCIRFHQEANKEAQAIMESTDIAQSLPKVVPSSRVDLFKRVEHENVLVWIFHPRWVINCDRIFFIQVLYLLALIVKWVNKVVIQGRLFEAKLCVTLCLSFKVNDIHRLGFYHGAQVVLGLGEVKDCLASDWFYIDWVWLSPLVNLQIVPAFDLRRGVWLARMQLQINGEWSPSTVSIATNLRTVWIDALSLTSFKERLESNIRISNDIWWNNVPAVFQS